MQVLDFHLHYNGNVDAADRFVELWRSGGVRKAVVFGMNRNDGSHTSVKEVAALAARIPDFFIPFAYLNPGHEDCIAGVRDAASRGFRGVKFLYPAKPYDEDEYMPLYEEIAKAGLVAMFHTGIVVGTVGRGGLHGIDFQRAWRVSSNYMRPAHLDRIARTFPEMTVVGAHVGSGAWYQEATEVTRWNDNVYFDLAIGQFHYTRRNALPGEDPRAIRPRIQELYDTAQLRLDRIVFGSDGVVDDPKANPSWSLRALHFEIDGLGATEGEKDAVRWGTAARLLGFA